MTSGPDHDEAPDSEGRTVPPYDGRRESADIDGPEKSTRDGARVGGATGPVEDPAPKAPDPDLTGPAHEPGTKRAEDQP